MRATFVLAVVLSAVVGLVSSDGAEPKEPFKPSPVAQPTVPATAAFYQSPAPQPYIATAPVAPAIAPSPYVDPVVPYPAYRPDEVQSLRQQYTKLAAKRAERMEAEELKKGIADMRRNCLIAELMELGNNAEGFDAMRVEVALAALSAKDRPELEKLSRDLVKELEKTTSKAE